jgi:hypothetical protein
MTTGERDTPDQINLQRDSLLTGCHGLGHGDRARQGNVERVAGKSGRLEAICEASETGFSAKPLVDAWFRVIHVAGKKHGDGLL